MSTTHLIAFAVVVVLVIALRVRLGRSDKKPKPKDKNQRERVIHCWAAIWVPDRGIHLFHGHDIAGIVKIVEVAATHHAMPSGWKVRIPKDALVMDDAKTKLRGRHFDDANAVLRYLRDYFPCTKKEAKDFIRRELRRYS